MTSNKCYILALAGCTNSGKSTLAKEFQRFFGASETTIINQDEFYKTEDEVEKIYDPAAVTLTEQGYYWSFDEKEAINIEQFKERILKESKRFKNVILDGNMITEMDEIVALCDRIVVLTLDIKTCRRRREARTDYVPPDTPGYFDNVAFPAYLRHLERARLRSRSDPRITFIDVSEPRFVDRNTSIIDFRKQILNDHIKLTDERLDVSVVDRLVSHPSCGAISTFNGVTRDNHAGRDVIHLSYDCHDLMAYKKLRGICSQIRSEFPDICKIAIFHRLGKVDVGESSVVISTSSPHRKNAIQATERCIDLLKNHAPIFKYEEYSNGETEGVKGMWKSNIEDSQKN
uniref:Molybdopterin synthase catalytic subunit n=1 Tax=Caenorhabditis tropicalis TaxID=1561998 RepID=A0A1I7TES9_9PELO